MAENPTTLLIEKGEQFINTAFTDLLHEYLWFTIVIVLAVIPLLLFLFIRMKGKAYIFNDTTRWGGHRVLIICILVYAGKNLLSIFSRPSNFSGTGIEKNIELAVSVFLLF